jgi:hypothetical protein
MNEFQANCARVTLTSEKRKFPSGDFGGIKCSPKPCMYVFGKFPYCTVLDKILSYNSYIQAQTPKPS